MNNLKIDLIKKVMMLDTRQELQNVLDVVAMVEIILDGGMGDVGDLLNIVTG